MLVRCSLILSAPGTDCLFLFRDMICIAFTMLFSVATAMRMDACHCMASSISAPASLTFHGGYASMMLETDSQSCSGCCRCLLTHLGTPRQGKNAFVARLGRRSRQIPSGLNENLQCWADSKELGRPYLVLFPPIKFGSPVGVSDL